MADPTDLIRAVDEALDGITPGLWEVGIHRRDDRDWCFVAPTGGLDGSILNFVDHVADECTEDDACFIAAAPNLVRCLRDALVAAREQLRIALIDQANTEAALAEANATIAALREREETAGHIAESERFRAIEATRELVEAREAIERVQAVIESPYHGTYWGRVQVPQEDLRRAIEGPARGEN